MLMHGIAQILTFNEEDFRRYKESFLSGSSAKVSFRNPMNSEVKTWVNGPEPESLSKHWGGARDSQHLE
jgi:hypothetical protein